MSHSIIAQLIESNSSATAVDLKNICKVLSIRVSLTADLDGLCKIFKDHSGQITISLHRETDIRTRFTFVAIATAEFILFPERVSRIGISYDMFFLADIYQQRYTYRMLLATRLAVPTSMISNIANGSKSTVEFIHDSNYLPEFLRCCVADKNALFLIQNFSTP